MGKVGKFCQQETFKRFLIKLPFYEYSRTNKKYTINKIITRRRKIIKSIIKKYKNVLKRNKGFILNGNYAKLKNLVSP